VASKEYQGYTEKNCQAAKHTHKLSQPVDILLASVFSFLMCKEVVKSGEKW